MVAEIIDRTGEIDSRSEALLSIFSLKKAELLSKKRFCYLSLSGVLGAAPLTRVDFVRQNPYLAEDWHSQPGLPGGLKNSAVNLKKTDSRWEGFGSK